MPAATTVTGPVRPRLLAGAALLACSVLLGSCSDSSGTDDGGLPADMQVMGGNGQEGTVGVELADALVVKVTDDRNRPVRNQLVNWRVTAGGGSVFAGSALTDRDGVARERWTLGTVAGAPQSVEARAVDNQTGQGIVFATFAATAKAGPASTLTAVTTGTQEGAAGEALGAQIVVRASDQYGNPVAGVTIAWEAGGGGSAAPATSTTDTEGEARTTWTLGAAAGAQQLTARSGSLAAVTFAAIARAGGPARLEIVSGNEHDGTVGAPLGEGLVVRAVDALGNGVPGVDIAWSVRSGGGTVSPPTATTNDAGIAQTVWTLGTTAGTQTVAASAAGVHDALFTALALAGPPTAIAIVSGDDQRIAVGQPLPDPLVVRVTDRYANPTPDVDVSWTVIAGGGGVVPLEADTDDNGRARAQWTVGSAGDANRVAATAAQGVVATFRATGLLGGGGRLENAGLTFVSGAMGGTSTSVYSLHTARVRLLDASGAPVANADVTWTGTGSSISPTSSKTDASGYATTSWRLGQMVAENTLTAQALDVEPVTFRILSTPLASCNVFINSWSSENLPSLRIGEVKYGIQLTASDFFHNPIAGVSRTGSGSGGVTQVGTLVTGADGRSEIAGIRAGTVAGQQQLMYFGSACLGSPEAHSPRQQMYPAQIYVVADPPSRLYVPQYSDGQTGAAGTTLPTQLVLYVYDQYGNAVPHETITWAVVSGGGSVTPASNTTDPSGSAWATWTLGPAVGNQQVSATTSNGITYIFNATAMAP